MLLIASSNWLYSLIYFVSWFCSQPFKRHSFASNIFKFFLCVYLRLLDWLPVNFALKYWPLSLTESMLENGVSDFESKSLAMHSTQNFQQNRNAAKSLSRPTTGLQFSNLGIEDVPLSSTNKKLGKSEASVWEKIKNVCFWLKRADYLFVPIDKVSEGQQVIFFLFSRQWLLCPSLILCTQLELDSGLDAVQSCYNDGAPFVNESQTTARVTFLLTLTCFFYLLYCNIFVLFPSFLPSDWLNSKKRCHLWYDILKKYFHFSSQLHALTDICQTPILNKVIFS